MEVKMLVQATPNPYAKKIICNLDVKADGKVTFSSAEDCHHIPLAKALYSLPSVTQVHFFENVITLTQDGHTPWDDVIQEAQKIVKTLLSSHDPDFETFEENRRKNLSPELLQIENILDQTIRPALQGDGGDLELIALEGKVLKIRYEGACGTCPSAVTGTLAAIQSVLREEYDPAIEVLPILDDFY